jgi:hypothetical protein
MSSSKPSDALISENHQIVEEKIVKTNGEHIVKKYAKGRFLGKVSTLLLNRRVGLLVAMNFKTSTPRKCVPQKSLPSPPSPKTEPSRK